MKDDLIIALIIAALIMFWTASRPQGLDVAWEWDGVLHQHHLRIR